MLLVGVSFLTYNMVKNKHEQTVSGWAGRWWPWTLFSQFWRPEVWNQGVGRGGLREKSSGKNPPLPLSDSGGSRHSLACAHKCLIPSPHGLFHCVCCSYKGTSFGFKGHPVNPGWPDLKILNYICKIPFSKWMYFPKDKWTLQLTFSCITTHKVKA